MSEPSPGDCPFCLLPPGRVLESNALAAAVADAFPVAPGHTLVIPRRHVTCFFELSNDEILAVHDLLRLARTRLSVSMNPQGYNVGVNVGTAAGQTVMHAHVHLIPRYTGDVSVPEGGVRNVIPGKGRY
jgi:diadenosine tetraphosphate (Ap4A) HIT family hydrolase